MQIVSTEIPDVKLVRPVRRGDARGFFSEIYREDVCRTHGIGLSWVQENHSLSAAQGVLRGLHFQAPPSAQAKLVRVVAGAIFDVALDLRWGSPDFGRHVAVVLSADQGNQLWIPEGFAHGFLTLEPNTEVVYKASRYYAPDHDRGLRWNDPALGIAWPIAGEPQLSDKDRRQPLLAELPRYFEFNGGA